MNPIPPGQVSQLTRDNDKLHLQIMAEKTKYKHLKPGDPGFDQVAAEILAKSDAEKKQKQEDHEEMSKSIRECGSCGRVLTIVGRGLCSGCYGREKREGTIDKNFPPKLFTPRKVLQPEPVKGQAINDPYQRMLSDDSINCQYESLQEKATMPEPEQQKIQPVSNPYQLPAKEPAQEPAHKPMRGQSDFVTNLHTVLRDVETMLLSKNKAYGNSALEPVRIFSRANNLEQINVRIDDKISRLMRGHAVQGEDTARDLLGYLVLREIAQLEG